MLHKEKNTEKSCWFFSLLKSSLKWCSDRKDCLGERTSTKPTAESSIPTLISLLLPHEILSQAEVMGRQSQVIEFLMLNQLLFISWTTEAKMSIFHVHRDRDKKISLLKLPSRSTPRGNETWPAVTHSAMKAHPFSQAFHTCNESLTHKRAGWKQQENCKVHVQNNPSDLAACVLHTWEHKPAGAPHGNMASGISAPPSPSPSLNLTRGQQKGESSIWAKRGSWSWRGVEARAMFLRLPQEGWQPARVAGQTDTTAPAPVGQGWLSRGHWERPAPHPAGKFSAKISRMTKINAWLRWCTSSRRSLFWLYLKPALSFHDTCAFLVWKRNWVDKHC